MVTSTHITDQGQDDQESHTSLPSGQDKIIVLHATYERLDDAVTHLERVIQKTKDHLDEQAAHITYLKQRLAELEAKQASLEEISQDIRDRLHAAIQQTQKALGIR